jgi:PAS domain S-box-containing protein
MFQLLSMKYKIYLAFAILISSVIVTTLVNNHISSQFNQQVKKTVRLLETLNLSNQNIHSHSYQAQIALEQFKQPNVEPSYQEFSADIDSIISITGLMLKTDLKNELESDTTTNADNITPLLNNILSISTDIKREFEEFKTILPAYSGSGSIYDARFDSIYDKLIYEMDIESQQKRSKYNASKLFNAKFYIANAHVYLAKFLYSNSDNDSEDVLSDLEYANSLIATSTNRLRRDFGIFKGLASNRISLHVRRQNIIDDNNKSMLEKFMALTTVITTLNNNLIELDKEKFESIDSESKQLELFSNVLMLITLVFASLLAYNLVSKLLNTFEKIKDSILNIASEKEHNILASNEVDKEFNNIARALNTVNSHVQERIQINEINNEVKNRIEIILNSADIGLLEITLDGKILSANTSACGIFYLSKEDLIGSDFQDYIFDENRNNDSLKHQKYTYLDKDKLLKTSVPGQPQKEIKISITIIEKNNTVDEYAIVSIYDLTDLRLAQSKLAEQTTLFTAMIHDAPEAIVMVHKDRTIRSVNPSFCSLFGYTEEEVKGLTTEMLYPTKQDYLEAGRSRYNTSSVNTSRLYETTYIKKDGTDFCSDTAGGSIKDPEGNIIGYMAFIRDTTHRKQQERKLQQYSIDMEYSKTQLDIATSSAHLGIWEFDIVSNKLYWNDEMFSIFGKTVDTFTNELKEWSECVHPDDIDDTTAQLNFAIENNTDFETQFRIIRPNGETVYLQAHAVVSLNKDSEPFRVIGTNWDITEQQLSRKMLSDNHQLLAAISLAQQRFISESNANKVFDELLQEILKITNSQYGFVCEVDCNNLDETGTPYFNVISAAEINNSNGIIEQGLHQKDFNRLIKTIIKNKETLISNSNTNDNNSDQHIVIKNYMGQPYFYGDTLIGIVGISNRDDGYNIELRDFLEPLFRTLGQFAEATRLEKTRKEQQEQVKNLALVASKTKNGVIITNELGLITWVNAAYTDITEFTLEESIGLTPGSILQGKDTHPETVKHMREQLAAGNGFLIDAINYSKSGRKYWASIEVQPITDENNTVTGFIAVETDITEKRQANNSLLDAVTRAETFAVEAQQASITKSEFLANMSHEIRTPMNGVIGMLNILIRSGLNDKQKNYASLAYTSAESLLTLINDILDFSKIEAGKLDIEQINFDFKKLINDFCASFLYRTKEKAITFSFNIDDDVATMINGDPNRIRQILNNLCGNALKFTHSGRISLSISKLDNHFIKFDISDTGIGIALEKIDTLFEQFTQADGSTTRKYGGTGLGLSISKQLCQLMDGEISATSEAGKGSLFTFTAKLPPALDDSSSIQPELASADSSSSLPVTLDNPRQEALLTLLLVEDNFINQEVAKSALDDLGYKVIVANNGEEALQILNTSQKFSAVLMDCQMPVMDGYDATKNIRNGLGGKDVIDIPIIAMTANAMKGDREKCIGAGMNDYLSKPLNMSDLEQTLNEWLNT